MRALIGLFFIALLGCFQRSGHPIHFVIPDDYRGAFYLIVDPKHGVQPVKQDSRLVFTIPRDGKLHVRSFKPFERWHVLSAQYANGKPIEREDAAPAGEAAVTLRSVGVTVGPSDPPMITYVVGTAKERDAVRDARH